MEARVLLAEDDKNLGTILKAYLEAKGFPTTLCANGEEAYTNFLKSEFDFCIFDVMMPLKDGFTLAKDVRKANRKIPILFLTAKSLQDDKLAGFQLGADDYITKPFSMEELLVRMKAILRRTEPSLSQDGEKRIYTIGNYVFEPNSQILRFSDEEQKLTSKETMLLQLLCENMNDVLDRSVALKKIWDDDSYFNARSMDVYVAKLRKFLKGDESVQIINVHGVGFRLVVTR
jgi:two-component system OmpR family response regulator